MIIKRFSCVLLFVLFILNIDNQLDFQTIFSHPCYLGFPCLVRWANTIIRFLQAWNYQCYNLSSDGTFLVNPFFSYLLWKITFGGWYFLLLLSQKVNNFKNLTKIHPNKVYVLNVISNTPTIFVISEKKKI